MVDLKTVAIHTTVLLMFLNATPALLNHSGAAEDLGIETTISGDKEIAQANENMSGISASGGFGDTLFTMYTTVTSPVKSVMDIVTAGPTMLSNAGLPDWLVAFIFVPQYLIVGGAVVYVLAGRLL